MKFTVNHKSEQSSARAGTIETAHGIIETPIFMPVGTVGTVKGVHRDFLLDSINAQIILGNTYHLYLRPGTDVLEKAGGLHKFENWNRPILTDSGGYQVYSLAGVRKIKEEGATFQSHIDGSRHKFTPENVMDIQRKIGADFIMAFDECTPYPCDLKYATNSMHLTHRWLSRCFEQFKKTEPLYGYEQALLPIVQGSVYPELRAMSAEYVCQFESIVYAIGGLSVGEPAEDMYSMTEKVCGILPSDKGRYLMGVGTPENILESISLGIDMFDCVMPTRNGRHGILYTTEGILHIKNKKWETDFSDLDPLLSKEYSKSYMRHLFAAGEMLGPIMASIHNLRFYLWLVKEARKQILDNNFETWKAQLLPVITQKL